MPGITSFFTASWSVLPFSNRETVGFETCQSHSYSCHPRGGWVYSEAAHWLWCAVLCVQVCRPVVLLMLLSQSIAFQWMRNPQNSPFPLVESTPPPNRWFIGPTRVFVPNSMSIWLPVFLRLTGDYARDRWIMRLCARIIGDLAHNWANPA